MPFENDPLQPPAEGHPSASSREISSRPYNFNPTGQNDIFDLSCTTQTLILSIILFSLCCTSCGLLSSVGYHNATPEYSYEDAERRVHRLYLTGYDPIMSPHARESWIEENGEPELFEIVEVRSGGILTTDATVIVQRDGQMDIDRVSFYTSGLIQAYIPKASAYGRTYTFTEAAIEIDPSVYPKSVDDIPESFLK